MKNNTQPNILAKLIKRTILLPSLVITRYNRAVPESSSEKQVYQPTRVERAMNLLASMEEIKRLKLQLQNLSELQIQKMISDWYLERPGAPHGDAGGHTFRTRELIK